MAEYHKRAGKLGGTKSRRTGTSNLITKKHNILHGENALVRVKSLPEGAVESSFDNKDLTSTGYILAHSETGHNHVLERVGDKTQKPDVQVYIKDDVMYLVVNDGSEIVHQKSFEKHETKTVEKGIWKITRKTEYDPFQARIREVRD